MIKKNNKIQPNEEISSFMDGESSSVKITEESRDAWKIYSLIGDALRYPDQKNLHYDFSENVKKMIDEDISLASSNSKTSFFSNITNYIFPLNTENLRYIAGISFVFFLGFSSSKIIENDLSKEVIEFASPSFDLSPIDSIFSCNFPELQQASDKISVDQLIEHHEGISGSSSLC
jgi:hypothetical protein